MTTRPSGKGRLTAISTITLIGFLIVVGQLWYLQLLEGPRLSQLADQNRIRVRPIVAPRGTLYDRHGAPLVETRPTFTVSIIPRELVNRDTLLARLSILLQAPFGELEAALRAVPEDSFQPVRVRRGLTFEDVIGIEERRADLPGIVVDIEPRRDYSASRFAAHLLGHVGAATPEQVRLGRYRRGDLAGQSGLERLLDESLRGQDGGEQVEVDALGWPLRVIRREEPRPGASVVTTLDRRIQAAAEQALGDAPGAVVVMDVRTGDLLAMASAPAFDLARFSAPMTREDWLGLVRDPAHPLLNRTFQSEYAPGSIFKLVVAAAALQDGVLTPYDTLPCPARLEIGSRVFRNWKDEDQAPMDLSRAIATSCNTFFYRLGLRVGSERIARYAHAFGLGQATGLGLVGEKGGLVPEPPREHRARPWLPGDTANMAIGQGRVLVTPLQVARLMAAIANGGTLWRPRLIQRIEADGAILSAAPEATGRVSLAPAVFAALRASLRAAVSDGGTAAAAAQSSGLAIAGKTGTAQIVRDSDSRKGQDHAWFAGYAPADDPQVVVVVLVERGGTGGKVAAPIAGGLFREIFRPLTQLADRPA